MLEIKELDVSYSDIQVLWGLDFSVLDKEIVSIVGSNGAGKTTLLKTLSGLLRPRQGQIYFNSHLLNNLRTDEIVKLGIVQVPEGRNLFSGMTVLENLYMGSFIIENKNLINRYLERVFAYFPILKERRNQLAGSLSGGEQQMCAIGRALMTNPKLLLIDELSFGLAPVVVENLIDIIKEISSSGLSILLVEQDVQIALEMANRAYLLETGRITLSGTGKELLDNDYIQKAYLGV